MTNEQKQRHVSEREGEINRLPFSINPNTSRRNLSICYLDFGHRPTNTRIRPAKMTTIGPTHISTHVRSSKLTKNKHTLPTHGAKRSIQPIQSFSCASIFMLNFLFFFYFSLTHLVAAITMRCYVSIYYRYSI